jgi:hypothetical protein
VLAPDACVLAGLLAAVRMHRAPGPVRTYVRARLAQYACVCVCVRTEGLVSACVNACTLSPRACVSLSACKACMCCWLQEGSRVTQSNEVGGFCDEPHAGSGLRSTWKSATDPLLDSLWHHRGKQPTKSVPPTRLRARKATGGENWCLAVG